MPPQSQGNGVASRWNSQKTSDNSLPAFELHRPGCPQALTAQQTTIHGCVVVIFGATLPAPLDERPGVTNEGVRGLHFFAHSPKAAAAMTRLW